MQIIKRLKTKLDRKKIYSYEYSEWNDCYESTGILKLAHSLEKGMGLPVVKKGYGIEKANKLIVALESYENQKRECKSYTYLEALKILKQYVAFQETDGTNLKDIHDRVDFLIEKLPEDAEMTYKVLEAGYKVVSRDSCIYDKDFDLYAYLSRRHSVRDFDLQKSICDDEIQRAISIASLAPSACNRQPCKVYYTLNSVQAKKVGEIIPGNKGYADRIPYYAVITVDRSIFDPTEMYQWFVNGGIFTAYFVQGLFSLSIGSCIFQFPFNDDKRSTQMHTLIGAGKNEAICAVVAFGKYKDSFKCICAQRKGVAEWSERF